MLALTHLPKAALLQNVTIPTLAQSIVPGDDAEEIERFCILSKTLINCR